MIAVLNGLSLRTRLAAGAAALTVGTVLTALTLFFGMTRVSDRLETALAAEARMARYSILSTQVSTFLVVATEAVQTGLPADTRVRDVVALASTLGSAHAIRVLCNGRNDQYWRSYMQELLGLEAPYQGRLRSSMVDAFNSAYSAEAARRNSCDAGAVSAEKVYASTGERLANSLVQANLPEAARRTGEDKD